MTALKTKTPLINGSYYHIFNRGVNKQRIFFTEKNYLYFLSLLKKYGLDYMHILAYSLLPNHFHLVVKIKNERISPKQESGAVNMPSPTAPDIGKLASKQLGRLFASYAMAINKQENRVGCLLDPKFKRIEITKQEYLEYAVFYTHYNPEKHGYIRNFKTYRFSSFQAINGKKTTNINRELVYAIFGGRDNFLQYHEGTHHELQNIILE